MSDDQVYFNREAQELIKQIKASPRWPGDARFSGKDMRFVRDLAADPERPVTRPMIYWLRDIRDKCDE